jgi:tetratricopeptide (TPR) repeat protein
MRAPRRIERSFCFAFLVASTAAGCSQIARTPILIPPEAVREWTYLPDGQTAPGRYVVRMTDGKREWEVEFPDALYGSEVRVPLKNGGPQVADKGGLTAADREMEEDRAAAEQAMKAADPATAPDKGPATAAPRAAKPKPDGGARKGKPSYLVGVARVRELYNGRNYEIALVELVDLERDYPNDEKLLAMKGSIYRRLGKNRLAREAWERVLAQNPDNAVVAQALRELAVEEERAGVVRDRDTADADDADDALPTGRDLKAPGSDRPKK